MLAIFQQRNFRLQFVQFLITRRIRQEVSPYVNGSPCLQGKAPRLQESTSYKVFKVQGTKRWSPHPKHAKQDPEMGGVVKESESKANGTSAVDVSNPALMTSRYTEAPLPTPLSPAPDACSPFIPDPKSCPPSQPANRGSEL